MTKSNENISKASKINKNTDTSSRINSAIHFTHNKNINKVSKINKASKINSSIHFTLNKNSDTLGGLVGHPDTIYHTNDQIKRIKWLTSRNMQKPIMEIGTACGYILNKINGDIGIDIRQDRLNVAKIKYPNKLFHYGNILDLNSFNYTNIKSVVIAEVLEHIKFELASQSIINCLNIAQTLYYTLPNIDKDINVNTNHEHLWYPTMENTKILMNDVNNVVKINYEIYEISNFLCGTITKSIMENNHDKK